MNRKEGLTLHRLLGWVYKSYLIGVIAFISSFFIAAFISSSLYPVENSSADSIDEENQYNGYYVKLNASDTVNLSVDGTPTGQLMAAKDTITVKTNVPTGYKLYITTPSSNIYSDTDTSHTGTHFSAVDGTVSSPTTLSANTWGFSLTSKTLPIPDSNSTWSAVPTTNDTAIKSTSSANTTGDNTDIYYGINADTSLDTGTYSTTITYTVFADGIDYDPTKTMQGFTVAECKAMTDDSSTTLYDSRDYKSYTVTKMKDGHCWMTENLKLGSTTGTMQLTPDDSNVSTNVTLPQVLSSGSSNRTSMQVWANTGSYDGYYYNWCAAVAYGAVVSSGSCDGVTAEQTNSVCPKGWRLPGYTDDYSFSNLFGYYSLPTTNVSEDHISEVEASPLRFTRAGDYFSGYYGQGSYGNYWSRVPSSSSSAYDFYYNSRLFRPQGASSRNDGFSVRCVLEEPPTIEDATYLQDVTLEMCNNTDTGVTAELKDKRGYGNAGSDTTTTYTVVKAKDGNCWMADNLRLYNKTISSEDSDFTSGTFTIPGSSNWSNNEYSAAKMHVADGTGSYADKSGAYYGEPYYNWCAATAQTSCGGTSVATTSICPNGDIDGTKGGFKLPLYGDTNTNYSYAKLLKSYSVTTGAQLLTKTELGFAKYYGGWYYYGPSERFQGSDGYFWSAIPNSVPSSYYLYYDSGGVNPSNINSKGCGFSVRCVVR